jgi:hypothetical protein
MSGLFGVWRLITFRCPSCAGDTFGYENDVGHCRRVGFGADDDCKFSWPRRHDWRVFVRVADGSGFRSAAELQAFMDAAASEGKTPAPAAGVPPREPFPALLQRLLGELMERPPTLGVVERWTREQHRAALHWCSRQIIHGETGQGVLEARPAFIEDGAATA